MSPPLLAEWIPKDTNLLEERTNLVGPILAAVAYGMLATLFVQCMMQYKRAKTQSFWIPYFNVMIFTLATIGIGCSIKQLQLMFIDYRNFPGGPNMFSYAFYNSPINMTAFVCYVLISWFADGLMLYRFMVIYGSRKWVMVLPTAVYFGFIAMSICLTITLARPGDNFFSRNAIGFGVSYWSMSVGLNLGLTAAIAARLLYMRSRLKAVLGSRSTELYTSVSALLVESASLYSVWALANIILYARVDIMQNIVLGPLAHIQGIASLLIIFRVGQGKAWDKNTMKTVAEESNMRVKSLSPNDTTDGVSVSTKVDVESGKESYSSVNINLQRG